MFTESQGYKYHRTPDPKGRGRPRVVNEYFGFRVEDLAVESYGGLENALVVITHIPTGTVVEGRSLENPGSHLAARREAMRLLKEKLTGVSPTDVVPGALVGVAYTEQQWMAIKAFYAEFPERTPAKLATSAKLANEAIDWYNARQEGRCQE